MTLKASPLSFPFSSTPAIGIPSPIRKGIDWCRHQLPFALDHINTWLIEDSGSIVIVDTGIADDISQAGWEKILGGEQRSSEISKIVITHAHPDHIGNASWLHRRTKASVWMTQSEFLTADRKSSNRSRRCSS